jgi:hypothetical protein
MALPGLEDGPREAFTTLASDGLCNPGRWLMGLMGILMFLPVLPHQLYLI